KKYEKKVSINENLVEQELKKMWNDKLAAKLTIDQQKVQNYLLGQVKKKFPDYPVKEVILLITNFLEKELTAQQKNKG
ncbi:7493_t:CDS:1, partial [Ambispora gerdemannii]